MATDLLSAAANSAAADDWADNNTSADLSFSGVVPSRHVRPNSDGTKTVIDYAMSDDGYLSVTTSHIRENRVTKTVSKGVAARKAWAKFGECAGKPAGLESGITTPSHDEINLEWLVNPDDAAEDDDADANYAEMAARDIQSRLKLERFKQRQEERKLGVANWAQMMSLEAAAKNPSATPAPGLRQEMSTASSSTSGKYVPPSKRSGGGTTPGDAGPSLGDGGSSSYSRDDSATVRISNVSRNTEGADLEELCKSFGPIRRVFLSKDRETGESKGFAFVAFQNRSDAEKCIQRLDGYGYDHLILSVEWSRPKEPRDSGDARQMPSRQ